MPSVPSRGRSRVTNDPAAARLNYNSRSGRRLRDLHSALVDKVGVSPDDVLLQADILRVAELRLAAENLRAAFLEGRSADADQIVRIENLAERAERRLNKSAKSVKPKTLADHAAARTKPQ